MHIVTHDAKERIYFTHEELKKFLDLPTPKSPMGYRDHVLLNVMYLFAMRSKNQQFTSKHIFKLSEKVFKGNRRKDNG